MRATVRSGGVVRACVDHTTQRIVSVCAAGGPVHVAPLKQKKKKKSAQEEFARVAATHEVQFKYMSFRCMPRASSG